MNGTKRRRPVVCFGRRMRAKTSEPLLRRNNRSVTGCFRIASTPWRCNATSGDVGGGKTIKWKSVNVASSARELRSLLPRMWRHFRGIGENTAGHSSSASCGSASSNCGDASIVSLLSLREWLASLNSPFSRWACASDFTLRRLLSAVTKFPRCRQRLGVRFKDSSKDGTWGVDNLVGHSRSRKRPRFVDNSWDYFTATFSLKLSMPHAPVVIRRTVDRRVVSARVERRKPGDGALPKIRELFTITATSRCRKADDRRKRIKIVRRAVDFLPAVIFRPLGRINPHRYTLIYLHGLGSSALGNYVDRPHYFMDGSVPVKVVIPTAPNRELSIFDEWWVPVQERKNKSDSEDASSRSRPRQKVVQFRAWYDYLTDADGKREDHINFQSLLEVQRALHSVISREADELGGRFDRVIVGGKSQGCCTALDATLTFPHRLGGFIGIVGHILGCTPVDPDGPQVKIPMHFFHEPEDHLMRWEWVQKGEQRLKDAGYHVRSRRQPDPEGNGHYVDGVEGAWIRSALRMICKAA